VKGVCALNKEQGLSKLALRTLHLCAFLPSNTTKSCINMLAKQDSTMSPFCAASIYGYVTRISKTITAVSNRCAD